MNSFFMIKPIRIGKKRMSIVGITRRRRMNE